MNERIRTPSPAPGASAAAAPVFVHLKVHSAYSLLEGALPISKIAKLAETQGFPAVALTDTDNLFGALEFSDKLAGAGIQPIVGVSLALDFGDRTSARAGVNGAQPRRERVALYAMDEAGYANLMKLVSEAHLGPGEAEPPHIGIQALEGHAAGLVVSTGGPDGPIDAALREGQRDLAEARLSKLKAVFGDRLYVELQRHGLSAERDVEPRLLQLAYELELPIVATNEAYFASPEDYEAHDALLCIAEGAYVVDDNRRRLTKEHSLKSAADMAALFADLPEALANTVEIAQRCAFRPTGRKPILPRFVAAGPGASEAEQLEAEAAELRRQAEEGLQARLAAGGPAPGFTRADYETRLAYELDVIAKMRFPGYFLIVADFIKWSKAHGVPVGPGRGSGAGSLVAYSLTITDLDPLRFGLLFERFLNPERVSMPDFDIDFCQEKRDAVIHYVQEKYGTDRVAQIITHGKLQARAVLRDVGRVLQMPYGQVDKLCKLVPNNPANPVTLEQAIAGEPKLQEARDADPLVARLLQIAMSLEGLYRHASTHAAGIVIGDRPLQELVPLTRDPKSNFPITQFNWKLVEAAGLVKFDFLGLKTLTVLQKAVELIERGRGVRVDLATLPLDDRATYEMLAKADTVGVFQLESTGMRESLKRLKPDRFEDIIAMVALYRPGPMDNIPTYIHRKHGEEPIDCLHPMLEGILEETYGVIIYQEQVIQIAQVMGGYTLGQADLLRRAMGKKDKAEMARQQARFVEGAVARGVKKADAATIFELVDKFAGYGFNKSHAAAYALVSYQTAYLKANFREEFLAASMTLDAGNTDKLALFAAEARRSGIEVKPPCLNASGVEFLAEPPRRSAHRGSIRYALAALRNIGAAAVASIVAEREARGPYRSLADFAGRSNAKALGKRGLETLAMAGAFDRIEPNRAQVHANLDQIMDVAGQLHEDAEIGQGSLFGGAAAAKGGAAGAEALLTLRPVKPWTPMERLQHEFEAVGFYLSGHPLDQYERLRLKLGAMRWSEFEAATERGVTAGRLAAVVVSARERRSQKGNKFAFAMFSDPSGQFEAVIFSETLSAARDLLDTGTAVLLTVAAERDGETVKLRVEAIEALDKAAETVQLGLRIVLDGPALTRGPMGLAELTAQLGRGKGEVLLEIELPDRGCAAVVALAGGHDVSPRRAGVLATLPCVREVVET
jgi:DNA polymerase III subunit alpha